MGEMNKVAAKKPEAKRENKASQTQKIGPSQSISSHADQILFLQRTIGNKAVGKLLKSGTLQAKFRIGQPGDIYEQEADGVAEQVMRMPEPLVLEVENSCRMTGNLVQRQRPRCKKKPGEEQRLSESLAAGERSLSRKGSRVGIRQYGSPFQTFQRQMFPVTLNPRSIVYDAIVQTYINNALQQANGNVSLAFNRLKKQREDPKNCDDASLAAAEHYLFARWSVASGDSYSLTVVRVLLYSMSKLFPIPRTGKCQPSPPSAGEIKWGLKGARDGRDDFKRTSTGRTP